MPDYYETLEIPKTASKDEINRAYKRMAFKWHPDRNPDHKEEAEERFKQIQQANDVLQDDQRREVYDRYGEEGLKGGAGGMPDGFPPGFPFSMFNGMFGGMNFHMNMNMNSGGSPPGPQRKEDIVHTVQCSLRDIYMGSRKSESFKRETNCRSCDSTGYSDKQNHVCGTCKGSGRQTIINQNGNMIQQFVKTCGSCKGSGNDTSGPLCGTCGGAKCNIETVKFDFEVRKGTKRGMRIVLPKMGHQQPDGTFGNVVLQFDVQEHPRFRRRDNHLVARLDISLRKALLGFRMGFEHIDGRKIVISSDDITEPGMIRRIPGLGLVDIETGTVGDLYLEMNIVFPKKFTSKQQKALDLTLHRDVVNEMETVDGVDSSRQYKTERVENGNLPEAKNEEVDSDDEDMRNVQCAQQ